jgi:hypothetical protein
MVAGLKVGRLECVLAIKNLRGARIDQLRDDDLNRLGVTQGETLRSLLDDLPYHGLVTRSTSSYTP